jgi:hypothetical protein
MPERRRVATRIVVTRPADFEETYDIYCSRSEAPWKPIISACSLCFALVTTCLDALAQPAPDKAALDELLERIKASAMRYDGHPPDFTCTEVAIPKEDSSNGGAEWRPVDTLEELVSFARDAGSR